VNLARHLGRLSWALTARFLPLIYGLVFILIVIPTLPVAEFGRYSLVFVIFTQIAFLNKSLVMNPMIRFAASPDQFSGMTRSGFYLSFLFYLLCGAVIWLAAPIAAAMLRIETADLRFVLPLIAAFFLREYGFCVQQTLYRTRNIFFIEAVYYIGAAGGFIYLAQAGRLTEARAALEVNLWAALASSLTALAVGFGGVRLIGRIRWQTIRQLVSYGTYTLGIGLTGIMIYGADVLVIGAIYTPVEVGIYNGAKAVYRVVSLLTQAAGLLVMPYAAQLHSEGRRADLRELFEKGVGYLFAGLAAVAVVGWIVAGRFYALLLGDAYLGSAALLRIMLIAAPFEGLFNLSSTILYGVGQAAAVALVSVGCLAALMVLLLPGAYLLGGSGAAGALAITLISAGIVMFRRSSQHFGSGPGQVLQRLSSNLRTALNRSVGR